MAAMTVQQLRDELAELPQDAIVVLSKDSEGNDFSPLPDDRATQEPYTGQLTAITLEWYVAQSTWHGELIGIEEEGDPEPTEEEARAQGGVRALVLWPTN